MFRHIFTDRLKASGETSELITECVKEKVGAPLALNTLVTW